MDRRGRDEVLAVSPRVSMYQRVTPMGEQKREECDDGSICSLLLTKRNVEK